MSEKTDGSKMDLFFPYYINQSRLFDIYAILNGGYSEYEEVTSAISSEKKKEGKADVGVSGGFKLIKIGGNVSGALAESNVDSQDVKTKKVQTVTSILSSVLLELKEKNLLNETPTKEEGALAEFHVEFKINSIKVLMEQLDELMKLVGDMSAFGEKVSVAKKNGRELDNLIKSVKVLFNGVEVVYETDDSAVIGNIIDDNLYQSSRSDLVNTKLRCLCQVKKVYPNGTNLMKNTIFTRIADNALKETFINAICQMSNNGVFEFDVTAIAAVENKPVYEVEIIALYK